MQTNTEAEFKTLLTKEEYRKLYDRFKKNGIDVQTNHYFDTARFSLKATDTSLRVRERDKMELTLKKKKGYALQHYSLEISKEQFEQIKESGVLPEGEIANEIKSIIGEQKLNNFMSLSTERMVFPYKNGYIFIDKNHYLGFVDFELQYVAKNYHNGKKEFIEIIYDLGIQYKKAEKKIKRAYNALRRVL